MYNQNRMSSIIMKVEEEEKKDIKKAWIIKLGDRNVV